LLLLLGELWCGLQLVLGRTLELLIAVGLMLLLLRLMLLLLQLLLLL